MREAIQEDPKKGSTIGSGKCVKGDKRCHDVELGTSPVFFRCLPELERHVEYQCCDAPCNHTTSTGACDCPVCDENCEASINRLMRNAVAGAVKLHRSHH